MSTIFMTQQNCLRTIHLGIIEVQIQEIHHLLGTFIAKQQMIFEQDHLLRYDGHIQLNVPLGSQSRTPIGYKNLGLEQYNTFDLDREQHTLKWPEKDSR